MSQATVEYVLFGLSIIALVQLLPKVFRYLRTDDSRWTAFGLLIFSVGGFIGNMEFASGLSALKLIYSLALVVGILVPIAARKSSPSHAIFVAPIAMILLLWAWLFGVNIMKNSQVVSEAELLIRLAPVLIWLALLAARDRSPLDRRMLATMALVGLTVPGIMSPFSPMGWRPCDYTKCGVFDGMFVGWYGSENFMGLQVAFIAVLLVTTFGLKDSLFAAPLIVMWLLATGSRTAQNGLLAGLVAWLVLLGGARLVKVRPERVDGVGHRLFLTLIPVAFVLLGGYLVITSSRGDFSGRGLPWARGFDVLQGNLLAGLGVDAWALNQRAGLLPRQLGPHSLYLFLAFSGGVVALVLFALFVRQTLVMSLRRERRLSTGVPLVVVFLVFGLLEVAWNPLAVDGFAWFALALALGATPAVVDRAPDASVTQEPLVTEGVK